jgi:predicted amidohydrolase YtcJ
MVLDAIEKALQKLPRENHRHRIEHCSVVNPKILNRVKRLGVVLALHSYVYEHGDKMEDYGSRRWPIMHANGSAVQMGIAVAGNSDSPVSAAEPLLRIQSMVTRKTAEGKVYGPEQRVSVETAIRIWTMGGAYASFEEDIKGSVEVGKLADFVVLLQDPTEVSPERIKDIIVERTYVGGRPVFVRQ